MAERGMGLKTGEIQDFVQSVVVKETRKTPFKDGRPGYDWYHAFMERNAHIVKPTFEKELESSRAKVSKDQTDIWYGKFRDFLKALNLLDKPNRIYNADETGFSMGSKAGKVIGPQWLKQVPHISGGRSKERYSVMFTACAERKTMSPFFVYPEPKPRGNNPLHGTIEGSELVYTKKDG
ncbi:hypothetical protein KUTeg_010661 [Tegillarca granosa]|uniref:Transposase n=1 Tax=Tegillarca granosa TaxID=220873 RepID=A0ABQ9F300_TEGGR|nr:hypothetical protein KUTeg_010661 [Tegillarca granosa]